MGSFTYCEKMGILWREADQPLFSQITFLTSSQPESKQVPGPLQDFINTSRITNADFSPLRMNLPEIYCQIRGKSVLDNSKSYIWRNISYICLTCRLNELLEVTLQFCRQTPCLVQPFLKCIALLILSASTRQDRVPAGWWHTRVS